MKHLNLIASVACAAAMAIGAVAGYAQAGPRPPALASPPTPNGAALYLSRCGGCHSIATNRVGPAHRGVVGRRAGSQPGFSYSAALRGSNITWTPQALDQWLRGPQVMVRGSRMFTSVPNPTERAAIIAYLRTQTN
ncbi:MAG: c-type cytochrome [Pseudomonadota bacterium]